MPFLHQRRRGATVLFRRKIPSDLRDRFGCGEIVRSLGRVTPGEARRLTHHLWSQTEVAFMFVRRVPGMTREEIGKVVDATVSEFRDQIDLDIADVRPGVAKAWLEEPAQVAAGLVGAATVLDHSIARGDLKYMGERARSYAADLLNKPLKPDSPDERRLARAMASALRDGMQGASHDFEVLAREWPKSDRSLVREVSEFQCTPEDLAVLRAAKVKDNLADVLSRLKPVADDTEAEPARPQPQSQLRESATAGPNQRNAGKTMSELWPTFCASKEVMKEWKNTEAISARTTLKLSILLQGDKPPGAYTAGDVSAFHQLLQQLPSKYYHNKPFRTIYESEGILALIEKTRGQAIERLSDKTWNSHNSTLNAFFEWCATKGDALPKGTVSICKGEFMPIPKRRRNRTDDETRRTYDTSEISAIYSAARAVAIQAGS